MANRERLLSPLSNEPQKPEPKWSVLSFDEQQDCSGLDIKRQICETKVRLDRMISKPVNLNHIYFIHYTVSFIKILL
jgi:hypothetical protein